MSTDPPAREICTGCQRPLDMAKPHVKIVRQIERERDNEINVLGSEVLAVWHGEHAPKVEGDHVSSGAAAELSWLRSRLKAVMDLEDWQAQSDQDLVGAAEACFRKALLYTPKRAWRR